MGVKSATCFPGSGLGMAVRLLFTRGLRYHFPELLLSTFGPRLDLVAPLAFQRYGDLRGAPCPHEQMARYGCGFTMFYLGG